MLIALASLIPFRRSVMRMAANWQRLVAIACDPYRPELHYMRGPGPKWHAKHSQLAAIPVRSRR